MFVSRLPGRSDYVVSLKRNFVLWLKIRATSAIDYHGLSVRQQTALRTFIDSSCEVAICFLLHCQVS